MQMAMSQMPPGMGMNMNNMGMHRGGMPGMGMDGELTVLHSILLCSTALYCTVLYYALI
jgi:hypothetical protein